MIGAGLLLHNEENGLMGWSAPGHSVGVNAIASVAGGKMAGVVEPIDCRPAGNLVALRTGEQALGHVSQLDGIKRR